MLNTISISGLNQLTFRSSQGTKEVTASPPTGLVETVSPLPHEVGSTPMTIKTDKLLSLAGLLRSVYEELTIRDINVFLWIALHEGCSLTNVAEALKLHRPAVSIAFKRMADEHNGRKGLGLLKIVDGPNYRDYSIVLTAQGKKILEKMEATV